MDADQMTPETMGTWGFIAVLALREVVAAFKYAVDKFTAPKPSNNIKADLDRLFEMNRVQTENAKALFREQKTQAVQVAHLEGVKPTLEAKL